MPRRSARRSIPILQNMASRCFARRWPFVPRPAPSELTNKAFERAGNAFEALVRNADPEAADRGFRRTIAATAYHLAGFSAVAYSLFNEAAGDLNLTPGETAVMRLVLRDLDGLRAFVRDWLNDEAHGDERIAAELSGEDADVDEMLATILNTTICRALGLLRFRAGDRRRGTARRARVRFSQAPSAWPTTRRMCRCGGSPICAGI